MLAPALMAACSSEAPKDRGTAAGAGGSGILTTTGPTGVGGTDVGTGGSGAGGSGIGTAGSSAQDSGGDNCGELHFEVERKPAEVMLVLDRSASMKDAPTGSTTSTSKWNLVVPGINEVIRGTDATVWWGLKSFPEGSGSECVAGSVTTAIDVPMGMMNGAAMTGAVMATTPEGNGTPTGDAIKQAVAYLKTLTSSNRRYILLATDGEPSCPMPSDTARTYAVQAVTEAAAAGFHTFVVGVATTKASATTVLNQMALAGLEARPDPNPLATKYYLANTQAELVLALQAITGVVSTCLFPLNARPPVPNNIAVKVDGVKAPQDMTHVDGWDYTSPDLNAVEVHGSWCEKIKTAGANKVEIIYGCPGVIIK
ncbi:MAG TPA: vWA domain-containing protein [Polyangiaceae bacterium]|nr:vWA domain-containing protein [Polyangiaceae bacterium]